MKPYSSLIAALPLLCAMASCTEVDLSRQNTLTVLSWISVFIGKRNTKETAPTAWE